MGNLFLKEYRKVFVNIELPNNQRVSLSTLDYSGMCFRPALCFETTFYVVEQPYVSYLFQLKELFYLTFFKQD